MFWAMRGLPRVFTNNMYKWLRMGLQVNLPRFFVKILWLFLICKYVVKNSEFCHFVLFLSIFGGIVSVNTGCMLCLVLK